MSLLEKIGAVLGLVPAVLLCPWLGLGMYLDPTGAAIPMWWTWGVVGGATASILGLAIVAVAPWRDL